MTTQLHVLPHADRDRIHEQRLKIVADNLDASRAELAAAMGLSSSGVGHWLRAAGINLRDMIAKRRTQTLLDGIKVGLTRAELAASVNLTRDGLSMWAHRYGIPLPDDRLIPRAVMCKQCGKRRATRSGASGTPASHGMCPSCRALSKGRACRIDGCEYGAVSKHGLCKQHEARKPARKPTLVRTQIVQHAFAFDRWTRYGTFGPDEASELEHFAWCCTCSKGGQANDRAQAERWARQHNADKHGTTA